MALLNDYEALSVVADAAQASLDFAKNELVNSSLNTVNTHLSSIQAHEYAIDDITSAIDFVVSIFQLLMRKKTCASITAAEDLIQFIRRVKLFV